MDAVEFVGLLGVRADQVDWADVLGADPDIGLDGISHVDAFDLGVSFLVSDAGVVYGVDLCGPGHDEEYSVFEGDLPGGVVFGADRDEMHELLGVPAKSRGAVVLPVLGRQPPADVWGMDGYELVCTYGIDDSRVNLVQLQPFDWRELSRAR